MSMSNQKVKRTLYVSRPVVNSHEIAQWALERRLPSLEPSKMHVTIMYSTTPVLWEWMPQDSEERVVVASMADRGLEILGRANDSLVFHFHNGHLSRRWRALVQAGASWDYPHYRPHITLSYEWAGPLPAVEPFSGPIVLGPEQWRETDPPNA